MIRTRSVPPAPPPAPLSLRAAVAAEWPPWPEGCEAVAAVVGVREARGGVYLDVAVWTRRPGGAAATSAFLAKSFEYHTGDEDEPRDLVTLMSNGNAVRLERAVKSAKDYGHSGHFGYVPSLIAQTVVVDDHRAIQPLVLRTEEPLADWVEVHFTDRLSAALDRNPESKKRAWRLYIDTDTRRVVVDRSSR